MKIAVRHQLSIGLPAGTSRAVLHILAKPQGGPTQSVLEWSMDMPGLAGAPEFADAFGNRARLVSLSRPEPEVTLTITGIVETIDRNGVVGRPAGEPVPALFRRATPGAKAIGAITSKVRALPRDGADRISLLHALMARVHEHVGGAAQSQTQDTDGQSQSQSQGTEAPREKPSAGDFAHAFIGSARALGVPARYVSGYLSGDEEAAAGVHAWAEAWDDGLGWIGFDPMVAVCPTDRHIRVAVGLDASYVSIVRSVPSVGSPSQIALAIEPAQ